MTVRIAAAHSEVTPDVRRNGRLIRETMRRAHADSVRLLHFPEGALSGYAKAQIKSWDNVDWTLLREEAQGVAALAGALGMWVVLGSNHLLTPPHRPHNSLYVISDRGALVDRYDKRYCSHTEITDWYTPGFAPVTFDLDGLRFGCALCIEVRFTEVFDAYRRAGVDCVLLSSYSDDPMDRLMAQAHAGLHNIWVSMATVANGGTPLAGAIIGPDGTIVAETVPGRSGRRRPIWTQAPRSGMFP